MFHNGGQMSFRECQYWDELAGEELTYQLAYLAWWRAQQPLTG